MADLTQQITEARKNGYSDDDIVGYLGSSHPELAPKIKEAQGQGYKAGDIVAHLSSPPVEQAQVPDKQSTWSHFFQTVNPVPQMKAAWDNLTSHPVQAIFDPYGTAARPMVKGLIDAHLGQVTKAKAAYDRGEYSEAVGHVLAAVLPGVGPMAAHVAEVAGGTAPEFDKYGNVVQPGHLPNLPGAAAEAAGMALPIVVGKVAPNIAAGLSKGVGAIRAEAAAPFAADPAVAMVRALKPTPSDVGFTDRLPSTMSNIRGGSAAPITGNEELIAATKTSMARHQQAFNAWINDATKKGVMVPGDSIADASANAIPSSLQFEYPEAAANLEGTASAAYRGKQFTAQQLKKLLEEKNAELDSFYNMAPGRQAAASQGAPLSVVKAQRDAIADALYKALDPQNGGAGPRQIQSEWGDMNDVLEAAQRRRNTIIGEKPVSKAGAAGTTLARIADLPGKALHGEIEQGLANVSAARYGTSDPLIARAFASAKPAGSLPMPDGAATLPGIGMPLTGRQLSKMSPLQVKQYLQQQQARWRQP